MLVVFVAFLFTERLSAGTVKSYLAAVRFTQISLGLGDPHMSEMTQLEYAVRGYKRLATAPGRQRLPITPGILKQLKAVWQSHANLRDASMLWAAATMCFFGFLRAGEVVIPSDNGFDSTRHLAYGDVRTDSQSHPRLLEVRIKASKTDPFRRGVSIYIGRTDGPLCPVAAILSYLIRRGSMEGPLFLFEDGKYLTRDHFVAAVKDALQQAGLDSSLYAGHSFRIGAATTAARRGVPESLIKTLGRWESAAYMLYIRTPQETLGCVARTLVGQVARDSSA